MHSTNVVSREEDLYSSLAPSSTAYDPSKVQQEIDAYLASHSGAMTDSQLAYLMYLMQEYGVQVTGQDAELQGIMDGYFSQIQNLWNLLNDAKTATGSAGDEDTASFEAQLNTLLMNIQSKDSFLSKHPDMLASMVKTLQSLQSILNGASTGSDPNNALGNLWQQYDPSSGGTTGDPGPMGDLMRELGELNQQFTGESQSVAAGTKTDIKMWQTEQDTFNNWNKALYKMVSYMVQLQRTN